MAKVARHGDFFTDYWMASGTIVATATKTFANGLAVARVGDSILHGLHYVGHHWVYKWGTIVGGSASVMAEGKSIARVGDYLDCGCVIVAGSPDVDAN